MENVQILDDASLVSIDGGGWKATCAIGMGFAICPLLGIGMAVGYYLD